MNDLPGEALVQLRLHGVRENDRVEYFRHAAPDEVFALNTSIAEERAIGDQISVVAIDHDDHFFDAFDRFLEFPQALGTFAEQVSDRADDHSHDCEQSQSHEVSCLANREPMARFRQEISHDRIRNNCGEESGTESKPKSNESDDRNEKDKRRRGPQSRIETMADHRRDDHSEKYDGIALGPAM